MLKCIHAYSAAQIGKYTLEFETLRAGWDKSRGRNLTTLEATNAYWSCVGIQDFRVSVIRLAQHI